MSGIPPVVRHMLVCREARRNPVDSSAVDLVGVFNRIRAADDPPFPFRMPVFGVYLQLAGGRGSGRWHLRIRYTDTGVAVYDKSYSITFSANPLQVRDLFVPVKDCVLPRAGLYVVQFSFEKHLLAQEALLVR